jgi:hypothetical protein
VAVVLVTDGAEGCAGLMEAGVSRSGAAEDGIVMVLIVFRADFRGVSVGSTQLETCISVALAGCIHRASGFRCAGQMDG